MHDEDQVLPALLREMDDSEFHHQFEMNASAEHSSTVKMLHFLNDLERRKSYLDLGYSSVFDYCVRKVKYSSSQAGRRIQAARCCRRYPEAWGYLREREVCIMTLAMIEPVVTDDNKDEIFQRVRGASRREVERLLSEYRPAAALRDRIRYVQVPLPQPGDLNRALSERHCARSIPEQYRDRTPTEEKVFVQFLADEEFLQLFEEIRDLMGGSAFESFVDVIKPVLKEYRDGFLPYDGRAVKEFFETLKGQVNPDLIFTHWQGDAHQDHRLLSELTWNTFRNHLILEYEIPKYDGDLGRPNLFVPLDAPLQEQKVDYLMEAFASQRAKPWFDRSTFLGLMRIRGMEANSPSGYAEAFYARKVVV